jgi:hypothetical protein
MAPKNQHFFGGREEWFDNVSKDDLFLLNPSQFVANEFELNTVSKEVFNRVLNGDLEAGCSQTPVVGLGGEFGSGRR